MRLERAGAGGGRGVEDHRVLRRHERMGAVAPAPQSVLLLLPLGVPRAEQLEPRPPPLHRLQQPEEGEEEAQKERRPLDAARLRRGRSRRGSSSRRSGSGRKAVRAAAMHAAAVDAAAACLIAKSEWQGAAGERRGDAPAARTVHRGGSRWLAVSAECRVQSAVEARMPCKARL